MQSSGQHHTFYRMFKKIYTNGLLNDTFKISSLQNIRISHGNSSNNSNDDTTKSHDSELSSAHCTSSDQKIPPPPTNCCMSGCGNCVWIQYAEELSSKLRDGSDVTRDIVMKEVQDTNMRSFLEMELRILKSKMEK